MFLTFEKNSAIAAIEMAMVVALITIARMLWSWCLFFIQAKRRNTLGKPMDELQNYKTFGFVSLPTGSNYSYMCGGCNSCFQSHEHAVLHAYECHTETTIINEV